jgi:CubicO group peptidase (beta-lactamase class C family)
MWWKSKGKSRGAMLPSKFKSAAALLVLFSAVVGCKTPHIRSAPAASFDFETLRAKLGSLKQRWNVPGMSAAIAQDGVVIWTAAFGYADLAASKRADPDTVYHLASLTKPFAATVLLQLVQEGRLNLDSPVSDYGIELKSPGVIRVRHLLAHTSEGVPGEAYRYSGARFGRLDKVIAGVTGQSFASEVSRRILEPLQLTNTSPNPAQQESCVEARRDSAEFRRRLAQGYNSDGRTPVEYKDRFLTAAGLVSTVGDVARFSTALDNGSLLASNTLRLAFTPALNSNGKPLAYGLGWFVQQYRDTKLVWHYGWWLGNSSLIIKIPEQKLTFVLLANSDGLSCKFDLGRDNDVRRSPFARAFLESQASPL